MVGAADRAGSLVRVADYRLIANELTKKCYFEGSIRRIEL